MKDVSSWKTVNSERVHQNPWYSVRKDSVIRPDGKAGEYFVVEAGAGAVVVIAEDGNDNLILVGQTRYPTGKYLYEFPAGKIEDGEDALSAAKRELGEEAGYIAEKWELLGKYYTAAGIMDENMNVFLARQLTAITAKAEGTEDIGIKKVSLRDIRNMIVGSELSNLLLTPIPFYERWKAVNDS
jgi:ADP-ribose pyrophosphatase